MNVPFAQPLPLGEQLKEWRLKRRLSQMDAALEIDVSARHLSFVETGRSKPSRDLILRMSDQYAIPLRERNRILNTAGYTGIYSETDIDAPEMSHLKEVFGYIIDQYNPYGAIGIDGSWDIKMENKSFEQFCSKLFGASLPDPDVRNNILKLVFHPDGFSQYIHNWDEFAPELLRQIRMNIDSHVSDRAQEVFEGLSHYSTFPKHATIDTLMEEPKPMVPFHFKKDDFELNLFCVLLRLNTAKDVTLSEMRIEAYLPADPQSKAIMQKMGHQCEEMC